MTDYNTMFLNQTLAGTGRKRGIGFSDIMLGRTQYTPYLRSKELEEREKALEAQSLVEAEEDMDRQYALQLDAESRAKEEGKKAQLIQGAGLAFTAARTPVGQSLIGAGVEAGKNLATKAYFDIGKGIGALPKTPEPLSPAAYVGQFARTGTEMVTPITSGVLTPSTEAISAWGAEPLMATVDTSAVSPWASILAGGEEVSSAAPLVGETLGGVGEGIGTGIEVAEPVAGAGISAATSYLPYVGWAALASSLSDKLLGTNIYGAVGDIAHDVGKVVGEAAGGVADVFEGAVDAVGDVIDAITPDCTLFSYLFGTGSHQVRYAKVFCYRHMTVPTLLGYYQTAEWVRDQAERHNARSMVLWFGESFQRYIKWRLGRGKMKWYDGLLAHTLLSLFGVVHLLTRNQFIPARTCIPMLLTRGR
jgi:hypothetical protein